MEQKQNLCSGKHLGCCIKGNLYIKTSLTTLTLGKGSFGCTSFGVRASLSLSRNTQRIANLHSATPLLAAWSKGTSKPQTLKQTRAQPWRSEKSCVLGSYWSDFIYLCLTRDFPKISKAEMKPGQREGTLVQSLWPQNWWWICEGLNTAQWGLRCRLRHSLVPKHPYCSKPKMTRRWGLYW